MDGLGWDSESAREIISKLDLHVGGSDHSIVCKWWWWLFWLLIAVLVSSLKKTCASGLLIYFIYAVF